MRLLLLLLLATWPLQALAYFDPGTGAVLLQLMVAAAIGGAYRFRAWLSRLTQKLMRLLRR